MKKKKTRRLIDLREKRVNNSVVGIVRKEVPSLARGDERFFFFFLLFCYGDKKETSIQQGREKKTTKRERDIARKNEKKITGSIDHGRLKHWEGWDGKDP